MNNDGLIEAGVEISGHTRARLPEARRVRSSDDVGAQHGDRPVQGSGATQGEDSEEDPLLGAREDDESDDADDDSNVRHNYEEVQDMHWWRRPSVSPFSVVS